MRPNKPLVVRSGSWFHVTNRGSRRAALFPSPREANQFSKMLGEVIGGHRIEVHAFCAMGTHYHLLVRADEVDARRAIAILDRSLSCEAENPHLLRLAMGRHLLRVTRYIHRNPVEAQLVADPADWPWSSYRGYLDPLDGPPWLRTDAVLSWLGFGARQKYRRWVELGTLDRC